MWGYGSCLYVLCWYYVSGSEETTKDPFTRPSTSHHESNRLGKMHKLLRRGARTIVIVTGPEMSELAGVPTYRNKNPEISKNFRECFNPMFKEDDSALDVAPRFRFLNNIRTVAANATPTRAHFAIAAFERIMRRRNKNLTVITENLDELHQRAGTQNIIECHGSMWMLRCSYCGHIKADYNIPLTPALDPHGEPNLVGISKSKIPMKDLPVCGRIPEIYNKTSCPMMARMAGEVFFKQPHSDLDVIDRIEDTMDAADMIIFIGTSDDEFKPLLRWGKEHCLKGKPTIEIREKPWEDDKTYGYRFHWHGDLNFWVPKVLNISQKQIEEEMALNHFGEQRVTPSTRTTSGIDWDFIFRNTSFLPDDWLREHLENKSKPQDFFDDFSAIKAATTEKELKVEEIDSRFRPGSYEGIL